MSGHVSAKNPARRVDGDDLRGRLLAGLPVTERWLEWVGGSTTVLEGGKGPPMVLLHGGTDPGGVVWGPSIPRLSQTARIVVPDLPGLGASEPLAEMNEEVFCDWLAAVVRMTCEERPTLLAHSLLGSLAARFAIRHGEMLRRLVLIGVPGVGPYRLPLGLLMTAIRFDLGPSEQSGVRFADWALLDPARIRDRDPEWFDAFTAYEASRETVPHVRRTRRQLITACTKQIRGADLRRIGVPTALVWGRADRMVRLRIAELAGATFGWPLQVIEDAGHVPMVEEPESFVRALGIAFAHTAA
jgi:pimeloyl-ACP methyl ester carboxylesterase